jgi:hypothetical protein
MNVVPLNLILSLHLLGIFQVNGLSNNNIILKYFTIIFIKMLMRVSVVQWSEFLATDPAVPGSVPGVSRFSEKQRVWNGVHSAS